MNRHELLLRIDTLLKRTIASGPKIPCGIAVAAVALLLLTTRAFCHDSDEPFRVAAINHYGLFAGKADPRHYGRADARWHPWLFTDVPAGCRVWIESLRLDFYAKVDPRTDDGSTEGLAMWAVHVRPPSKREWAPLVPADESGNQVLHEDPSAAADAVLWAQPPVQSGRPAYTPPTQYSVQQHLGDDHTIWFRHAAFSMTGRGRIEMETAGTNPLPLRLPKLLLRTCAPVTFVPPEGPLLRAAVQIGSANFTRILVPIIVLLGSHLCMFH